MVEVQVLTTKRADVFVSSEQLDSAFSPEPGLKLWDVVRVGPGKYKMEFGSRTETTKLVGPETHFER